MPLVIWNNSLSVGIPEIDQQHKQLIEQLNLLVDAMHANSGKEEIQRIVRFLDIYVAKHFGYEEGCMHRYKCPVASENAVAHSQFINTLQRIKTQLNQKGPSLSLAIEVNEQLLDWFVNHIKKIDRELKPCMNS